MAFCINCGEKLAEGAKFCSNCGKAVTCENTAYQRKTVCEGTLHKCPNCGEFLNSFTSNCPSCGHEIRDAQSVSSIKQLAIKLEQVEAKRLQKKNTNLFTRIFGGGEQLQSIDAQKIALVRNYPIPNTKEDVLEFIVFAAANIDLDVYGFWAGYDPARRGLSDAWLSKLEQADQKAEIMFGQSQEYVSMRNVYEKKLKAIKRKKHQIVWILMGWFCVPLFIILILALTGILKVPAESIKWYKNFIVECVVLLSL